MTATTDQTASAARHAAGARAAVALACVTVLLQVAYPLVTGAARDMLTVATVMSFFLASVVHALYWRGVRFTAALVAVTAGGGLAVEALGTHYGVPFGSYAYGDSLGWTMLGVPVVIPLAWTMMAYPALLVGRRITRHPLAGPLVAGWALAAWDLFLDPQMVAAGHWVWSTAGPSLTGIPVTNYLGWLATAVAMMGVLWRLTVWRAHRPDDRVPLALYLWTWGGSVLAHAVFLGMPRVAFVGGLGMGAVVALLAWTSRARAHP